ncbi:MAG TPA: hypothetical protein VFU72_11350, partial [Nitrolancea sp.]|nr:hypothetical protein [Nitrolancea sp.]
MKGWIGGLGGAVVITVGVVVAGLAALAFVAFNGGGSTHTDTGKVGRVDVGSHRHDRGGTRAAAGT